MSDKLYTILMDYDGGTYASQVRGNNIEEAQANWLNKLEAEEAFPLPELLVELRAEINSDDYVPIQDMKNIWCGTCIVSEKLALIHFVVTEEDQSELEENQ